MPHSHHLAMNLQNIRVTLGLSLDFQKKQIVDSAKHSQADNLLEELGGIHLTLV